jgi:hypothetical protein
MHIRVEFYYTGNNLPDKGLYGLYLVIVKISYLAARVIPEIFINGKLYGGKFPVFGEKNVETGIPVGFYHKALYVALETIRSPALGLDKLRGVNVTCERLQGAVCRCIYKFRAFVDKKVYGADKQQAAGG